MIAIVGGGISGLALGEALREAGADYVVLEASERVGGVIRTLQVGEARLELGPQRIRWGPDVARVFGAPPAATANGEEGPPLWIVRGASLHPVPRTPLEGLRSPILSRRGRLRAALEPLAALRPGPPAGASAGAVLRRHFGDEAYRTLLGPFFGGLYGSDPDEMDFDRTLGPALRQLGIRGRSLLPLFGLLGRSGRRGAPPPPVVPPGGMAALAEELRARQQHRVRTGRAVTGIEAPGTGPRFRLVVEGGGRGDGGERVEADEVILCVPPSEAARLLAPLAPSAADRIGGLAMNRLALVHLQGETLPPGLGYQVAFGERMRTRGVTFAGNLTGTPGLAVAFLGGSADREIWDAPDEELAEAAAREYALVTGIGAAPLHVHRTEMPAWDRSWRRLDGLALPAGIHLLTNYTGRPGIVGRLREARRLAATLLASPVSTG